MAGSFPVMNTPADLTVSGASTAQAQPVQNLDDDGCFCCCTHLISHVRSASPPPEPAVPASSVVRIVNPSAVPRSPFHPPKH
jgi:hypothetical protein